MHKRSRSIRNINSTPGSGNWGLWRERKTLLLFTLCPLYSDFFFIFFPWEYISCIAKLLLKINNYNIASPFQILDCEIVFKCNWKILILGWPPLWPMSWDLFLQACHHTISLPSPTPTACHHVFLLACLL